MDGWQSGFVDVPGGRIHYVRGGGGDPSILLVHGATEDGQCFPRVADALRASHTVVMPDARGHGQSDPPPPGWDYATQGEDLVAVITQLGLERPVVVGHSMGCGAALHLAARHPDLVRALVLEDPGPWWMPVADVAALMAYAKNSRERNLARLSQTQAEAERDIRARYPNWPPAEVSTIATAKRRVHPDAFVVYAPDYWIDLDWAALLRQVACPVLLIHTDPESGGILGPEAAAAFKRQAPQTQVAHILGATHSIRRDRFPQYLAAVQDFLTATTLPA